MLHPVSSRANDARTLNVGGGVWSYCEGNKKAGEASKLRNMDVDGTQVKRA